MDWQAFLESLFLSHSLTGLLIGLVILFFGSLLASATIFLPVPFYLIVFGLSAWADSLPLTIAIGLSSGIGAGIGEMSGYLLGRVGLKAVEKTKKFNLGQIFDLEAKLEKQGAWAIFVLAIIPVPFDIIGIAAGLIRFDFKSFFAATVAGKTVRYILIALGGYFGIEIIKRAFIH